MGHYRNFTVDFPSRLKKLDLQFRRYARSAELDVTYTLMKLSAAFLLPYERLDGDSGARNADVDPSQRQSIRRDLELDRQFSESSYCGDSTEWRLLDVTGFSGGPQQWHDTGRDIDAPVRKVLEIIRHSVAHSNLFFDGGPRIAHVYLGNRQKEPMCLCRAGSGRRRGRGPSYRRSAAARVSTGEAASRCCRPRLPVITSVVALG